MVESVNAFGVKTERECIDYYHLLRLESQVIYKHLDDWGDKYYSRSHDEVLTLKFGPFN